MSPYLLQDFLIGLHKPDLALDLKEKNQIELLFMRKSHLSVKNNSFFLNLDIGKTLFSSESEIRNTRNVGQSTTALQSTIRFNLKTNNDFAENNAQRRPSNSFDFNSRSKPKKSHYNMENVQGREKAG